MAAMQHSTEVQKAIEAFANGQPVMVFDSDFREKETDLLWPAAAATPAEIMRFWYFHKKSTTFFPPTVTLIARGKQGFTETKPCPGKGKITVSLHKKAKKKRFKQKGRKKEANKSPKRVFYAYQQEFGELPPRI